MNERNLKRGDSFMPPRTLTGDRRTVGAVLPATPTALLIDIEYDAPKILLVSGQVSAPNEAGFATLGGSAQFRIKSGLDRAQLDEVVTNVGQVLSRIFIARSVQVIGEYTGAASGDPCVVAAAVVPIDGSINAGDVIGLTESRGNSLRPDNGQMTFVPASTVAVSPDAVASARWFLGVGQRAGFTIYNTASKNLYIALSSDGTPADPTTDFTCMIVPGGYYEAPYGYSGPISLIWDGASAGGAAITWLGNQNGRTG